MNYLFIGGFYDGHRMSVENRIWQINFEQPIVKNARYVYTKRALQTQDGERFYAFVLDGFPLSQALEAYQKHMKATS